jgi:hypothetical protein
VDLHDSSSHQFVNYAAGRESFYALSLKEATQAATFISTISRIWDFFFNRTHPFKNISCTMYETSALLVGRSALSGATSSVTASISSPKVVFTRFAARISLILLPVFLRHHKGRTHIWSRLLQRNGATAVPRHKNRQFSFIKNVLIAS